MEYPIPSGFDIWHPCDGQAGSAGLRIDLGARHPDQPGRYILVVECDGAQGSVIQEQHCGIQCNQPRPPCAVKDKSMPV